VCEVIAIVGPPRSGTTIMAYMLGMHPDVTLYVDGLSHRFLETRLLRPDGQSRIDEIERVKQNVTTRYLLLKKPGWDGDGRVCNRYIVMSRDQDELVDSWRRFRPLASLADCSRETLEYFGRMSSSARDVGDYVEVRLGDLKRDPTRETARVAQFLGLDEIDSSCITSNIDVDDDARQRLAVNGMIRGNR
jgi:hypothetical protein